MIEADVRQLVDDGAIFYLSHSGGKDSQAMYAHVRTIVPDEQIVVVHAHLGEIEWEGVEDHIRATTLHPLNTVRARKTFFQMVRERARKRPDVPSFPASSTRQCTSDLKRAPIYKFIRRDMNGRGAKLGVNTMGLRAEESYSRRRLVDLAVNETLSNRKRTVYNWLPIHRLKEQEVFERIAQAGQTPFWAYAAGNRRLSCVFCILACPGDLANGRKYRPELFEEYTKLEEETGWTMFSRESLKTRAESAAADENQQVETQSCLPFA